MKKLIVCILTLLWVYACWAQELPYSKESLEGVTILQKLSTPARPDTGCYVGGTVSLNLSQVSLTNWIAGGQNSVAVNGMGNFFANYKVDKTVWDNSLNIAYGQMKQGERNFFKTDDKLDYVSKYGHEAFGNWYYSGLFNFRSQFDVGYKSIDDKTIISRFLAPAYIVGALGLDYKPNKYFSAFISPITGKATIVRDSVLSNAGAFGVEKGKMMRYELGGFTRLIFHKDIIQNVNLMSTIDLFSNYLYNPQNIDINWQSLLNMKINKFFSAGLSINLIYDDDIVIPVDGNGDGIFESKGPRTQFKEVLGIGLSYKLN